MGDICGRCLDIFAHQCGNSVGGGGGSYCGLYLDICAASTPAHQCLDICAHQCGGWVVVVHTVGASAQYLPTACIHLGYLCLMMKDHDPDNGV